MSSRFSSTPFWRTLALFAVVALASGSATAQWLWIDNSGNKVFSDTAPPPGTPDKNILKKPGGRSEPKPVETASTPASNGGNPAPAGAPKVSGKDEQLEAKKKQLEKQAEEAAEAKKKAEMEQYAKSRAENCERAKRAKATLDSGVRVTTTNSKGEQVVLDDKARAAEVKRAEDLVRSDCGPLPTDARSAPGASSPKP